MNTTVKNPLAEDDVKTPSSPALMKIAARAETDANAPVNLLLVDDEPRNLSVLESILASPHHQLVLAQSAGKYAAHRAQQRSSQGCADTEL